MRILLLTILMASVAACGGTITTGTTASDTASEEALRTQTNDGGSADGGSEDSDGDAGGGTTADGTETGGMGTADSGDGGANPDARTDVAEMQTGALADGTPVTLSNVIVSSTMSVEAPGFYVQDVGGGEWSGVFVYTQAVETEAGMPEPAALTVNVGDVLNLSGTSKEFYDQTQLVLASMGDIEVVGAGAPVEITSLTAPPPDWEPYEGVLVSLSGVRISVVPDPSESERAPVTDWGVSVADQLMDISMTQGTTYSSITGILTYSWDRFRIAPRTTGDLVE